ncbi:MAG: sensor histidine kinase KdpD [Anaerolineae bacterium]
MDQSLSYHTRGKLRIFLGYAAGVGKTYAMLEAALRRQSEGLDVVAAFVETHRKTDADNLLKHFESLARREGEMDVDAVLSRRPQIALVDELAHTNKPGLRHPRRYQDVEELLDAGIDVYTTVNIHHIESLKDIVAQITGVTVTETVPDRLLDNADDIELIDLLPEDLLLRMNQSKLDSGHQPADNGFLQNGNLTALRELAMRQAARRVDEQMRSYMQTQEIPGPWAASERLLVCLSPSPWSTRLIRAGCRLARELDADWYALYVEAQMPLTEDQQTQLQQNMGLAEKLGGRVMTLPGQYVADTLVSFAQEHNITKIIIGQPMRSRWQELLRGSVVNRLIRQSGGIDVYVINSGEPTPADLFPRWRRVRASIPDYMQAVALTALTTFAGGMVDAFMHLNPANLVMFYLIVVMVVALRSGYGPAVVTAVLSVVMFNFFFVPPQLTFHVNDAQYLLTFAGLLIAGVVIANLTSRARQQTESAQRRERETAQLYSLSRELSATIDPDVIIHTILEHAQQTFRGDAVVFVANEGKLSVRGATPNFKLNLEEQQAANWAFHNARPAGRDTETLLSTAGQYIPLKTAQSVIGVLGLVLPSPLTREQIRLVLAFSAQAALAIEAAQLGQEAQQTQLLREKEKLQTALLNSISHDLRTPLVSITGTLSSLRDNDAFYDSATRRDLLEGAYFEAERLNRLVGNLLDMSRLEAGSLRLKQEPYDLQEIIGVARAQLRERLNERPITIDLPDDLPMICVDAVLFAQVLVNLLDNAIKYSDPGSPIEICAQHTRNTISICVADRGIGIPQEAVPHIFEKFYRAESATGRGGSGLGLSICQGIVEAHSGRITVESRAGGGTCFIITLPLIQMNVLA